MSSEGDDIYPLGKEHIDQLVDHFYIVGLVETHAFLVSESREPRLDNRIDSCDGD